MHELCTGKLDFQPHASFIQKVFQTAWTMFLGVCHIWSRKQCALQHPKKLQNECAEPILGWHHAPAVGPWCGARVKLVQRVHLQLLFCTEERTLNFSGTRVTPKSCGSSTSKHGKSCREKLFADDVFDGVVIAAATAVAVNNTIANTIFGR